MDEPTTVIGKPEQGQLFEATPLGSVICWQDAPIGDVGEVGDQPETLLPVIINRLQELNRGMPNRETSLAITKCEEALHWLQARRAARVARGVEGTAQP